MEELSKRNERIRFKTRWRAAFRVKTFKMAVIRRTVFDRVGFFLYFFWRNILMSPRRWKIRT